MRADEDGLAEAADHLQSWAPASVAEQARRIFGTIPEIRSIVLCVDGSPQSRVATTWAGAIARKFGSRVTVVTVIPDPADSWIYPEPAFKRFEREAQRFLKTARTSRDLKGIPTVQRMLAGSPALRIVELAQTASADLVVLGGFGRKRDRFLLGSVADAVKHHAACSVLIAKAKPSWKAIVAGSDGSAAGMDAVRLALHFGALFDCPVTVLHADPGVTYGTTDLTVPDDVHRRLRDKYPLELMRGRLRFHLEHGSPVRHLKRLASRHNAALIVVGSRGLGKAGSLLLGSVSDRLSHQADQSVLIARPREPA